MQKIIIFHFGKEIEKYSLHCFTFRYSIFTISHLDYWLNAYPQSPVLINWFFDYDGRFWHFKLFLLSKIVKSALSYNIFISYVIVTWQGSQIRVHTRRILKLVTNFTSHISKCSFCKSSSKRINYLHSKLTLYTSVSRPEHSNKLTSLPLYNTCTSPLSSVVILQLNEFNLKVTLWDQRSCTWWFTSGHKYWGPWSLWLI